MPAMRGRVVHTFSPRLRLRDAYLQQCVAVRTLPRLRARLAEPPPRDPRAPRDLSNRLLRLQLPADLGAGAYSQSVSRSAQDAVDPETPACRHARVSRYRVRRRTLSP